MSSDIDDQILQDLYSWIDEVPLSRQKRNISRDFSDGVMMAELVKYYFPNLVDLHNFPGASAGTQKKKNWHLLNWKVFKKLNFELSNEVIDSLVNCKPGTIERVLLLIRTKIDRALFERKRLDPELPKLGSDFNNQSNNGQSLLSSRPMKYTERTLATGLSDPLSPTSRNRGNGSVAIPRGGNPNALVSQADLVPRISYEERVQDCLNKEEMINVLQSKVRKMEHLLHLKDIRIEELTRRVENLRPSGNSNAGGNTPQVQQPKQLSRATMQPSSLQQQQQQHAPPPLQQAPLTQAQLQQLQMQFPPPYGQMPGQGQGQGGGQMPFGMPPMGPGGPQGYQQFNPNFPPFMPLPPIQQPHAQGANMMQGLQNNEQEMVSSDRE